LKDGWRATNKIAIQSKTIERGIDQ